MKWLFLFLISVCFTSCSYLTDFYIFNTTEDIITITYKTRKTESSHPFVTAPKIFNFKTFKNIHDTALKNNAIKLADSLTVIATLQPKQALWVGVERTFILKNDRELLEENLEFLTIRKNATTKEFTPAEISAQCKEITHKIVGIAVE